MKPDKVNVLGVEYTIIYVDKPSDVDLYGRQSLWGQTDYWTRSIRIYDNGHSDEDIFHTILHEVIHCVAEALHLEINKPERHEELDLLSLGLVDVFMRNGWIKT